MWFSVAGFRGFGISRLHPCLGPIILSPLNGPVKMSPREPGDISLESERVATSGRHLILRPRNPDVCQSRGAARSIASAYQTSQIPLSARQRSGSGSRQPRSAQPAPLARSTAPADSHAGPHALSRLQRSSSLREAGGSRRPIRGPRNPSPPVALGRTGLAAQTTHPHSSLAPPRACPRRGNAPARCQPASLAGRSRPSTHLARLSR